MNSLNLRLPWQETLFPVVLPEPTLLTLPSSTMSHKPWGLRYTKDNRTGYGKKDSTDPCPVVRLTTLWSFYHFYGKVRVSKSDHTCLLWEFFQFVLYLARFTHFTVPVWCSMWPSPTDEDVQTGWPYIIGKDIKKRHPVPPILEQSETDS